MTSFGGFKTLRRPWQYIHFAGTELATSWCGYMSGAVQSGYRAAAEVLHCLNPDQWPAPQDTTPVGKREENHKPWNLRFFVHLLLGAGALVLGWYVGGRWLTAWLQRSCLLTVHVQWQPTYTIASWWWTSNLNRQFFVHYILKISICRASCWQICWNPDRIPIFNRPDLYAPRNIRWRVPCTSSWATTVSWVASSPSLWKQQTHLGLN